MKCVKVFIRRGKLGETQMVYPPRYNADEVDRNGLGPCGVNGVGAYSKGIGKGAPSEFCYIMLDDALANEYATAGGMEIVDGDTADANMEAWRIENHESEIVIRDPEAVRAVQEKKARAAARAVTAQTLGGSVKAQAVEDDLTAEDIAVLDPENPMPGLNKRLRKVNDIAAEAGQTLTPVAKARK